MINFSKWKEYIDSLTYEPLFVTISGAHLYGFPSPDSDIDLRGCHRLPLSKVVGLSAPDETLQREGRHTGIEVDLVSHDVGKYLRLLVKNNGYILEQIFSPLIVTGASLLEALRPVAANCITRHHYHHYRGFYATQRKLIDKQEHKRAKSILYAYRVLLTGIHLLDSGKVEANLLHLNEHFRVPGIDELVASKTAEKVAPADVDWAFHEDQLNRLEARLDQAFADSKLPEGPERQAVNELLLKFRLESQLETG